MMQGESSAAPSDGALAKIAPLQRRAPLLRALRVGALRRRNGSVKLIEFSPGPRGRLRISVQSAPVDRAVVPGSDETATAYEG